MGIAVAVASLGFGGFASSDSFAQDKGAASPAPAAPSAPPASSPAPQAGSAAPSGTPATVVDGQQVESLLGKEVQSGKSEDMGRIADIIVDKTGQIRAVVIDFGGFLGVGSRKIAVDWKAIHVAQDGKLDRVTVDIPRDELRVAPIYKEGEPVVILGPTPDKEQHPAAPEAAHSDGTSAPPAK